MNLGESQPSCSVVILAAGAGTRMKSDLPKPLHPVAGQPMLAHVLATARQLAPVDVTIVGSEKIRAALQKLDWTDDARVVVQDPPNGTADAVRVALEGGANGDTVLVLYADHPIVTTDVLQTLLEVKARAGVQLAVMTCSVTDAAGYGRIDRDEEGRLRAIVERVDDDPSRRIGETEVNSGVMALDRAWASSALGVLQPNHRTGEFFLTDLVEAAYQVDPMSVDSSDGSPDVLIGVNDRVELAAAEELLYARKRRQLQVDGVTLISPSSNLIAIDARIGRDTIVGPNCMIETGVSIGSSCRIGPYAILRQSVISDRVRIESSTVEQSEIGPDSDVGPYSHLRSGTELGSGVHIGNFAELKNAHLGDHVRVGHFSYLGDAGLGDNVNIGAGSITCNYDGEQKHRTEIGSDAFIGSDSMLIAPLRIGKGARTGAGAVVTKDVADGATVVGMPARQIRRRQVQPENVTPEGEG